MQSIDELVLQINCTDGTLYCIREFLLDISKTFRHLQAECSTPINDVEIPFEKNIFGFLIKFANVAWEIPYPNPILSFNKEKMNKLMLALDWLDTNENIIKLVKERVFLTPISQPIILDQQLLSKNIKHNSSAICKSIAQGDYFVLQERERDSNTTYCHYRIFTYLDDIVDYCYDHYIDIPREKRENSLIMYSEDYDETYYMDVYGLGEEDYEYLFEQMERRGIS